MPSDWESKQLIKTSEWSKKLCVYNKQIHKNVFKFKQLLSLLNYVSKILLLYKRKKLYRLNQERNMHKSSTANKQKKSKTVLKQICRWILMRGQQGMDFSTRGSVIMDYGAYFGQKQRFNQFNDRFLFHTNISLLRHKILIDRLELCGLLADYCDVFISCLDSHSDGTHSLHRSHWWASDVMLYFSKSVLMKKQTHLHLGWPEG